MAGVEGIAGSQQTVEYGLVCSRNRSASLWDYKREGWARRFFEQWRAALKWQRLKPYEEFAALTERHWDGIAAYCNPANKVSLGFVEGLNNKIRVLQRRPTDSGILSICGLRCSPACSLRSEIYVTQWQVPAVTVLNHAGVQVRTIGRRWTGPGEFLTPASIGWKGDTLWVVDPRNRA
ncbi:MAG: transposase [Longimicrobiales bacterium]